MKKTFLSKLLIAYSFICLLIVYVAEYGFNIAPCKLCYRERIPYLIILVTSVMNLKFKKKSAFFLTIITLSILSSFGLSLFHVLIENDIISFESSCMASFDPNIDNLNDFTKSIMEREPFLCNSRNYLIPGITWTTSNLLSSIFMMILLIKYYLQKQEIK